MSNSPKEPTTEELLNKIVKMYAKAMNVLAYEIYVQEQVGKNIIKLSLKDQSLKNQNLSFNNKILKLKIGQMLTNEESSLFTKCVYN